MESTEQESLRSALEQSLYLQPSDLEANRNGQLTPAQIQRIQGQLQAARIQLGCMISVLALPVLALAVLISGGALWLILLVAVVILFGIWRTLRPVVQYDRELRYEIARGEVAAIAGPLEKEQRGRAGNYVGTQGKFFPATQMIFGALSRGIPVVIYYLPKSNQLLSIEIVESSDFRDEISAFEKD